MESRRGPGPPAAGNTAAMKGAACCAWVAGLGFGLPCAYGTGHLARHGEVWTFLGFPAYGHGPFERAGLPTTVPLMGAFLAVCAAEAAVGALLWRRRRRARGLALALLPAELVFWTGFALPFGFAAGAARTLLVVAAGRGRR